MNNLERVNDLQQQCTYLQQQLAEAQTTLAHAAQIKEMDDQLIAASQKREAEAIAACKLKDSVISRAANHLDSYGAKAQADSVRDALSIQPDDSALKAWLREPSPCREDGRCQYAIDHGAEGIVHCPKGKCCMPLYSPKGLK